MCTSASMACKYTVFKTEISDFLGPFQPAVSGPDVRAVSESKGFSCTVSNSVETIKIQEFFKGSEESKCHAIA